MFIKYVIKCILIKMYIMDVGISMAQAVPNLCVSRKVLIKH